MATVRWAATRRGRRCPATAPNLRIQLVVIAQDALDVRAGSESADETTGSDLGACSNTATPLSKRE
jgi:hypothetical protein